MSEERDQPVAEEGVAPESVEGVAEGAEAHGDDQQLDDEGNPIEGDADDDSEEIEHEGAKYKLPKPLAKEWTQGLLRQADYTRKTQEVAEHRRALENERQSFAQQAELHETTLEERATLKAIDAQLQQYQQLDWQALAAQGEGAVAQAMAHMRQLESASNELKSNIHSKQEQHRLESERRSATALQEAEHVLSRELPGYGRELVQKVAETAQSVGFTPMELRESLIGADGKPDTRSFKVLARLHAAETELAQLKSKTAKAQTAEKQANVQPAKTVSAKGGGYKPGLDDSLPPDEWRRRFQAQLAKAR